MTQTPSRKLPWWRLLKKKLNSFERRTVEGTPDSEQLKESYKIEDDPENMKKVTKIYTDQIEKLTEKLMDYKRRLKTLEKEREQAKPIETIDDKKAEDLQ